MMSNYRSNEWPWKTFLNLFAINLMFALTIAQEGSVSILSPASQEAVRPSTEHYKFGSIFRPEQLKEESERNPLFSLLLCHKDPIELSHDPGNRLQEIRSSAGDLEDATIHATTDLNQSPMSEKFIKQLGLEDREIEEFKELEVLCQSSDLATTPSFHPTLMRRGTETKQNLKQKRALKHKCDQKRWMRLKRKTLKILRRIRRALIIALLKFMSLFKSNWARKMMSRIKLARFLHIKW